MRKTLFLVAAAAASMTACEVTETPANAPAEANATAEANAPATVDAAAEERAIRGQVDRWLQRVKAKDAAAIAQFYTEDGAVMPANMAIGKGRPAIQKIWADMMATPGFDLTFAPEQIIISSSGDMALDRGTYRLTVSPAGTPQTDTGKYVVVWRKVGGEWKAAADIFNSDLPAAGG
jgi:uncharacterized protein (TIGR02246 family)